MELDSELMMMAQTMAFNIHHEGAMLACAKLGLWQRALEIYYHVSDIQQQQDRQQEQLQQQMPKKAISYQDPPFAIPYGGSRLSEH